MHNGVGVEVGGKVLVIIFFSRCMQISHGVCLAPIATLTSTPTPKWLMLLLLLLSLWALHGFM